MTAPHAIVIVGRKDRCTIPGRTVHCVDCWAECVITPATDKLIGGKPVHPVCVPCGIKRGAFKPGGPYSLAMPSREQLEELRRAAREHG